jgi:hypothetical protein
MTSTSVSKDLVGVHRPAEHDQGLVFFQRGALMRVTAEINIANPEPGLFQQWVQGAQRLVGNMLKNKYFGSGHTVAHRIADCFLHARYTCEFPRREDCPHCIGQRAALQ